MKLQAGNARVFLRAAVTLSGLIAAVLFAVACEQLDKPETKAFYSETRPPRAQEFRWSNGKMPQSFDPARAAAPPETDIVRAIYEGLTEIDPKTLEAVPGIAVKWESSEQGRIWTFELRKDAKWSNGEPLTAADFVRSWKRLASLEDPPAHFSLVTNIVGMDKADEASSAGRERNHLEKTSAETASVPRYQTGSARNEDSGAHHRGTPLPAVQQENPAFGAEAIDIYKLKVTLIEADAQFPRLAAQPILRPVHGDGNYFSEKGLSADIVTNGAFSIGSIDKNGVVLEKSTTFFGKSSIALEKVHLVAAENADKALADYREGKVDAVTNTEFEPLALKLLTPFVDFRRKTHSALNFYEFNRRKAPFNDRRVREAMAISIDRKRISEDLLEGATEPAYGFLPFERGGGSKPVFKEDAGRAKELMQRAGFHGGKGFPVVRLVINRNDQQRQIAEAVAGMWKENLGIETEIEVHDYGEMEAVRESGDFDLIRRGAVLPTSDETANMLAIFHPSQKKAAPAKSAADKKAESAEEKKVEKPKNKIRVPVMPPPIDMPTPLQLGEYDGLPPGVRDELTVEVGGADRMILTEEEAVMEVPAIPLYFPTSYSLVKPYVSGFDMNALDAPILKIVRIDSTWKADSPNNS